MVWVFLNIIKPKNVEKNVVEFIGIKKRLMEGLSGTTLVQK